MRSLVSLHSSLSPISLARKARTLLSYYTASQWQIYMLILGLVNHGLSVKLDILGMYFVKLMVHLIG